MLAVNVKSFGTLLFYLHLVIGTFCSIVAEYTVSFPTRVACNTGMLGVAVSCVELGGMDPGGSVLVSCCCPIDFAAEPRLVKLSRFSLSKKCWRPGSSTSSSEDGP